MKIARITKEQLELRKAKMMARAKSNVTKTEILQFRLDAESIGQLYEVAGHYKKPVGAMVREWVMERLQKEITPENPNDLSAQEIYQAILDMNNRLEALEKEKRRKKAE